jgi:hypothetical protein
VRRSALCLVAAVAALSPAAGATTFSFLTAPFEGSTALTTPGRQIVGGEDFITFSIASDVFHFDATAFGVASPVSFANDLAGNLSASGLNVIALQTFDDDNDPTTPFGAGTAATLLADQITSPGPGFFVYFNSGLDLARLVYSTDLSDNTADLKILARMTNLSGQSGRDAIPTFTASNFAIVPEPSSLLLVAATGALWACGYDLRLGRGRR